MAMVSRDIRYPCDVNIPVMLRARVVPWMWLKLTFCVPKEPNNNSSSVQGAALFLVQLVKFYSSGSCSFSGLFLVENLCEHQKRHHV